ncbi:uncharacterized protein LOC128722763 [Anopheles nili]|uniref:uncharacterized protein LOC128722763 n=1 Tax=Anopheles nili TaxID=185578 RepID=UPI00237BD17D|nr:uncharacterized protein LOC128722763 [Anopheles nili]
MKKNNWTNCSTGKGSLISGAFTVYRTNEALCVCLQALSLTTLLAEEPTGAAILQSDQTADASLQPLSDQSVGVAVGSSEGSVILDGRRRRRLVRKRKRRPLQDDYWPQIPSEDEEFVFERPTSRGRKRLPNAGTTGSVRWEGIHKPQATVRPGVRAANGNPPARANDWMHNPYTDARIDATGQPVMADVRRTPTGGPPTATGNLSPIDPNRSRRITGARVTEHPPTNAKAYRKPYSQARRNEELQLATTGGVSGEAAKPSTSAADLKALLKQSDGLSLSEILQQRNISLQDLIKGKQMALAALTQSPLEATTTTVMAATDGESTSTPTTILSPTLASSVRFRPSNDPTSDTGTTTLMTTLSPANDLPTTSGLSGHPSGIVEDEDTSSNAVVDEISRGEGAIFPTVEIRQLALRPVLPVAKDEQRLRPIKGVASRIRPDLSNTHIRTEPAGARSSPVAISTTTTTTTSTAVPPTNSPLALVMSTPREKWTPSAALVGQRQKLQSATGKQPLTGTGHRYGVVGFSSGDGVSSETLKLSSAEATSMLPEAEAMVELHQPTRHQQQHLLRVPKLKPRIAIKPRLPNAVPPTAATPEPSKVLTTDRQNLSDVELEPDEGGSVDVTPSRPAVVKPTTKQQGGRRQQRLNEATDNDDDEGSEPELNIIEKFTSPEGQEDPAPGGDSEQAAVDDLIGRISEQTQRSFTDSLEDLYRDVTESNPSLFNDLSPITSADDRRELLELMEDRRIGSRLAKVLSQRNMTLEQLLEHRRRGSSQLHLAEIANGKTKPIDDKIDIVTAFEHFPRFNIGNLRSIRPDDIKLDSQGFSYFTSIINIRPSEEAYKEARALQDRHRVRPAGTHRNEAHFLAKGGSKDRLLVPSKMSAGTGPVYGSSSSSSSSDGYDHRAERDWTNDLGGDLLDLELSGHGFQHHRSPSVTIESTSVPIGVRSAIVASSAIVGVSLVIFIGIFVACRLRQRRRQKLNYTEHFNMAKGRVPILHGAEQEPRRSSPPSVSGRSSSLGEQVVFTTHRALASGETMAASTSGRQRSMMDPNSVDVQDYLWDRKPFQ